MNKVKYLIASAIVILMIVFANKVQASTGKVDTETLNLRKEASTSADILKLLSQNDEVEIISESNGWYKVKYKDIEGYVSKDYIKVKDEEPKTETTTNTNPISNNDTVGTTMTIDVEKTAIKILPLINSNTIGMLKKGDTVTVVSKANKWTFIQTDTISGWIVSGIDTTKANDDNNDTTKPEENKPTEEPKDNSDEVLYDNNVTKYINALSVYIRKGPSTSEEIVTSLIKNTDVTVIGENGDWYKVKYNEHEGYIYKNLLSDSKEEETNRSGRFIDIEQEKTQSTNTTSSNLGEEIVAYAKQYLGCPYVYGGSGSSSFDCSGFTMYVYKHFGYSLSHSASAQANRGEYVAKEDLQPGDLVFFLEYPTMDGIGHCGIYIGDGEFIHASSGSGYCVKISTLLSGGYYNRYATARRLI